MVTTPAPAATEALHTTLACPFEDAVPAVQLEHELAGFETVAVTRLDQLVAGVLGDELPRVALVVVCHAAVARDAIEIDPTVAGLLPCTTVVVETDDKVAIHHISAAKAIRDLGVAPEDPAVGALVEETGALMEEVWGNIERIDERY